MSDRDGLRFHGAAGEVTGSCTELTWGDTRVVIDCGMFQGGRRQERRNPEAPPIDWAAVDVVVLTHAHLDHCGRLPLLGRWGYTGRVVATPATAELAEIILRDAAKLMAGDAARKSRKRIRQGKEPLPPLYTDEDVDLALARFDGQEYDVVREVAPGVSLRLHDAGHILGSATLELTLNGDGPPRTLVMSGDIGKSGSVLMRDPTRLSHADMVVMESTYGDRDHRDTDETLDELVEILDMARTPRGKVLIPAFAVGRSQAILYYLAAFRRSGRFNGVPVFLDSPMAIKATELYRRHLELMDEDTHELLANGEPPLLFDDLSYSQTVDDSCQLNRLGHGVTILAGSGMMTGGRILHHLKHNLWRPETHLIVPGYQAEGSLGRLLVDGASRVRVLGEKISVAARIHTLGGFSAHAGRSELLAWAAAYTEAAPRFVLNHGERRGRDPLARSVRELMGVDVLTPETGTYVPFEFDGAP